MSANILVYWNGDFAEMHCLHEEAYAMQIKQKGVYYKKKELTNHRIDSFFFDKEGCLQTVILHLEC